MLSAGQPFLVELKPFEVLPEDERQKRLEAYLEFLRARDGSPDVRAKTLSKREQFFQEISQNPVRWKGPIERDQFRAYLNKKADASVDKKVLWLLACAKSNIAENYGVALDLRLKGDHYGSKGDEFYTFIDLEEFYHTRILKDVVRVFGIEFELGLPRMFTRFFTELEVRSPFNLRIVTALCGELFGSVIFQLLWECADVFADEPAVLERIRMLLREILVDEMGHVAFGHANVGPVTHKLMRAMLPAVARHFLSDFPEFAILGGGRQRVYERVLAFDLARNDRLWRTRAAAA